MRSVPIPGIVVAEYEIKHCEKKKNLTKILWPTWYGRPKPPSKKRLVYTQQYTTNILLMIMNHKALVKVFLVVKKKES